MLSFLLYNQGCGHRGDKGSGAKRCPVLEHEHFSTSFDPANPPTDDDEERYRYRLGHLDSNFTNLITWQEFLVKGVGGAIKSLRDF